MKPKQITKLRTELGLSFDEFAALIGCHRSTVQRWERNKVPPSAIAVVALNNLAAEAKRKKGGVT